MGIRKTDLDAVAFYDSTTMWAFGPVFESDFDADNFANWAQDVKGVNDLRRIDLERLKEIHDEWLNTDWDSYDTEYLSNHAPFYKTC